MIMSKDAVLPLRILCIHGYRQNSSSFREKTGALRKLLKKQVEFLYINAPHQLPPISNSQEQEKPASAGDEDQRGWWFSNVQARSFDARQECESSLGLEESVEAVRVALKDQGPFDGILGFSQGAALVAMLCALQERKLEPIFNFRFAVLVAGFLSACAQHQHFYENLNITLPSLHVFGQEDKVIPEQMSRELLPMFPRAHVLSHPGGHFIPAASAHRPIYQEFLQRFQQ
ncbi:esterase OVCA2 [Electrophorus electricus]|uniref:Esterase OVCA2 n=1 Tax=Electrophorus electricus TaxID=8005 RepID=A0A4W4GEG1_ELEEL|nr:esterase OVCA2 [Electrophorus electricus]